MQPERIVLIPPTHEFSTPSFHVVQSLREPFVEYLKNHGVEIWAETEPLGEIGPRGSEIDSVSVEEGTPIPLLEGLVESFLESVGHPSDSA